MRRTDASVYVQNRCVLNRCVKAVSATFELRRMSGNEFQSDRPATEKVHDVQTDSAGIPRCDEKSTTDRSQMMS